MAFYYNNQYQTRTSSYHSSQTTAFDLEESFQRYHPNDHGPGNESNPWRVTEEEGVIYHPTTQQNPYECSVAPQQQFIPLTLKNLEDIKLETFKEKWDRIYYWLKQSRNAPPPPDSDMMPPSNDWSRRKLVPKVRIAPPRSGTGGFNQDCRKEPERNYLWNDDIAEVPVPVRSPAWCENSRKSAGQKRKRVQEEECMHANGQSSMNSFAMEDRRVQSYYEEDNGLHFTRYEESVYESQASRRIRLAPSEDYGVSSTETKLQARVNRFQRDLDFLKIKNPTQDELNCTLDEVITKRVQSRKQIRNVPDHGRMYGSVPTPPQLMHSSPPELEMQPYEHGTDNTRSAVRGQRRPIVIDGSNVAYGKTLGKYFDSNGICICVNWFLERGFTDIVVVVSEHRLSKSGCRNPEPLRKLQRENKLVTCWSRKLPNGRWVTSYDDRMIVEIAHRRGGVIISNDRFRDLQKERPDWAYTIGTRVVGFRFMPGKMDEIMFPDDPFGRYGPRLEELLRF